MSRPFRGRADINRSTRPRVVVCPCHALRVESLRYSAVGLLTAAAAAIAAIEAPCGPSGPAWRASDDSAESPAVCVRRAPAGSCSMAALMSAATEAGVLTPVSPRADAGGWVVSPPVRDGFVIPARAMPAWRSGASASLSACFCALSACGAIVRDVTVPALDCDDVAMLTRAAAPIESSPDTRAMCVTFLASRSVACRPSHHPRGAAPPCPGTPRPPLVPSLNAVGGLVAGFSHARVAGEPRRCAFCPSRRSRSPSELFRGRAARRARGSLYSP